MVHSARFVYEERRVIGPFKSALCERSACSPERARKTPMSSDCLSILRPYAALTFFSLSSTPMDSMRLHQLRYGAFLCRQGDGYFRPYFNVYEQ